MLLDEWVTAMRSQPLSERTITERVRLYDRYLRYLDGSDPLQATPATVSAFMAAQVGDNKPSTVATYHAHLRAFYAWLLLTRQIEETPYARIKVKGAEAGTPRGVTDDEWQRLLDVKMRPSTRLMLLLACKQGLRCVEIARVRGEAVDYGAMTIRVIGKGGYDQTPPLSAEVADYARELGMPLRGWWFPSTNRPGQPIGAKAVSDSGRRIFKEAQVNGGMHRLRHTFGTDLIAAGVNLRMVQKLMRHRSIVSTTIYTGTTTEQERAALDSLDRRKAP